MKNSTFSLQIFLFLVYKFHVPPLILRREKLHFLFPESNFACPQFIHPYGIHTDWSLTATSHKFELWLVITNMFMCRWHGVLFFSMFIDLPCHIHNTTSLSTVERAKQPILSNAEFSMYMLFRPMLVRVVRLFPNLKRDCQINRTY